MNRRAVTTVLIAAGTIGPLSVLAQQVHQQPLAPQYNAHHDPSGYHHGGGVSYAAERDAVISEHLAIAREQLQEARREVDPGARIDRTITALEEVIAGIEYIEVGGAPLYDGGNDHHDGHASPATTANRGGCN